MQTICYLVDYTWQSSLTKNISRWSAVAFYLAVIINFLVALFYPFDKGSKMIGWYHYLSDITVDILSLNRWCHHSGLYCHLVAIITLTNSTATGAETMAYSCSCNHHSIHYPLYHYARHTTDIVITRLYTSQSLLLPIGCHNSYTHRWLIRLSPLSVYSAVRVILSKAISRTLLKCGGKTWK